MSSKYPIINNNETYAIWKIRIHSKLVTKGYPANLFSTLAADVADVAEFFEKTPTASQSRVVAHIFNSLDEIQLRKVKDCKTADAIIAILDVEYESKDSIRLHTLIRKLFSLHMSEDADVRAYILDFEDLLSQLKVLGLEFKPEVQAIFLLVTLPESWSSFLSAINVSLKDKMTLANVKEAAILEGLRKAQSVNADIVAKRAFVVKAATLPASFSALLPGQIVLIVCAYCHRKNHAEDNCYQKHPEKRPKPKTPAVTTGVTPGFMVSVNKSILFDLYAWYVDSACTIHMTGRCELLFDYKPVTSFPVTVANNTQTSATGQGIIRLVVVSGSGETVVEVSNVFHVPGLGYNLYSTRQATRLGIRFYFFDDECIINNAAGDILPTVLNASMNLHRLNAISLSIPSSKQLALIALPAQMIHLRLGHLSVRRIQQLSSMTSRVQVQPGTYNFDCQTCAINKAVAKPITTELAPRCDTLFGRVHSDLCGPFILAFGRGKYFASFIDNKSRYCWLYYINLKSDLPGALKSFILFVQTQFGVVVKILHSD